MIKTLLLTSLINSLNSNDVRDVAQAGSVPGWGSGGRKFESCRPDFIQGRVVIFKKVITLFYFYQAYYKKISPPVETAGLNVMVLIKYLGIRQCY